MAILTVWDDRDQTIIRLEFESEWTWADLEAAIEETDRFISSVEHRVDIIVDLEGSQIPKDFMNAARSLLANPEPRTNEGHRVVVGASKMMRSAYTAVQKAFGSKIEGRDVLFANSLADARAILRGLRMDS